jgi:hypothetical protein
MWATAASGGALLFALYAPFAILKPKNRKTEKPKNRNPYGTKAIAVGRNVCACGAQQVKGRGGGVGRRGCRVAFGCVCCF